MMVPHQDYEALRKMLKALQSRHRFEHSVSVGDWAAKLGKKFGWDPVRARRAGLLHDYAKEWSPRRLKSYAQKNRLAIPDKPFILKHSPNMLHAYVSADVARKKGWVRHKNDLLAISSHTLGRVPMTLEEKILFIADFSAPGREYRSAEEIREIAISNLETGFRETVASKMKWQIRKTKAIHPLPIQVWNHLVCGIKR